jgi:hypothetical protein
MKGTFTRTYRVKVPFMRSRFDAWFPCLNNPRAAWSARVALVHKAKNAARFSTAKRPLPGAVPTPSGVSGRPSHARSAMHAVAMRRNPTRS